MPGSTGTHVRRFQKKKVTQQKALWREQLVSDAGGIAHIICFQQLAMIEAGIVDLNGS